MYLENLPHHSSSTTGSDRSSTDCSGPFSSPVCCSTAAPHRAAAQRVYAAAAQQARQALVTHVAPLWRPGDLGGAQPAVEVAPFQFQLPLLVVLVAQPVVWLAARHAGELQARQASGEVGRSGSATWPASCHAWVVPRQG